MPAPRRAEVRSTCTPGWPRSDRFPRGGWPRCERTCPSRHRESHPRTLPGAVRGPGSWSRGRLRLPGRMPSRGCGEKFHPIADTEEARGVGVGQEELDRAAPDQVPSPRARQRVDAGLLAGDGHRSGRYQGARHSAPRQHELIDTVRRTAGDDRDTVRLRLLELFEVVGADDPRVAAARSTTGCSPAGERRVIVI